MTDHPPNDPRHAAAGPRARGAEAAGGWARAGSDPAYRPRPATARLRSALWVPPFGDLADPAVVPRLAAEAEEAGWHGVFLWDHLCWRAPVRPVADPWITLAAAATATELLRLGPMVTPLARRQQAKVARETVTLDWLSGGRLTLGVGLGSDRFGGELSATGEQLDDRRRGQMLDEALEILTAAWSGHSVHHHGEHYTVNGVQFLPQPVRQRVPVWVAGFPGKIRPLRRAARYDGFFPVNLEPPTSSPRPPPPSPASASTRPRHTTSRSRCRPAPTQRPTRRRAPPGGWLNSSLKQCRWTRCAACSATAQQSPEPLHPQQEQGGSRHGEDTVITMTAGQHTTRTPPATIGATLRRASRRAAAALWHVHREQTLV